MKILMLGAAGFLGTNLVRKLSKDGGNRITVADRDRAYFKTLHDMDLPGVDFVQAGFEMDSDHQKLVDGFDVIYHLISTTAPGTSNKRISDELKANVVFSSRLFEACVQSNVKKVVFISSGGAIYGKECICPISEENLTNPISSYGIQKLSIEKLLYLYNYLYGLDYRIIRLSNPYGPYQRPNGELGVVTTFIYKALKNELIEVYGDGSVIRDFIYVDDAVRGIVNIADGEKTHKLYNLGSGIGISVKEVIRHIEDVLGVSLKVKYTEGRKVDVPVNFLDINRYEKAFGKLDPISLEEGIRRTADFMKAYYNI